MKGEIWKDIEGFEGRYQVSNLGRVKSLERTVWDNRGYYKTVSEKILKPQKKGNGYLQVQLSQDGKEKWYLVHRLVAIAFLPNPNNLPQVNHISEDKLDNRVSNLEWVTCKENTNHGTGIKRRSEKRRNDPRTSKPIIGIDKITGLIVDFPSIKEASRQLSINKANITSCLKSRCKSAGGYVWYYADADAE